MAKVSTVWMCNKCLTSSRRTSYTLELQLFRNVSNLCLETYFQWNLDVLEVVVYECDFIVIKIEALKLVSKIKCEIYVLSNVKRIKCIFEFWK